MSALQGAAALAALALFAAPAPAGPPGCLASPYLDAGTAAQAEVRDLLDSLAPTLAAFPSLRQGLDSRGPEICLLDKLHGAHGVLEVEDNRIALRHALPRPMQQAVLIHELRHLDQMTAGICPSPDVAMAENARATFALEADASAITLLVAWHMREGGDAAPWQALEAWRTHSDIAAAFAAEMAATGDAPRATAAAFAQWYASDWRRENYYLAACSDYLDQQDRSKALPRYRLLSEDFLDTLCRLPDGTAYPCAEPEGVGVR